jgi:endonuclease/exonuclease/phosphatase family metal-dependent hydrolase
MKNVFPILVLVSSLSGLGACIRVTPPKMSPAMAGSCRVETLRWLAPSDHGDRARLDSWCAAVGPPVLQAAAAQETDKVAEVDLEDVVFVSWNIHVGNGDLVAFVKDLRAGAHTGGRPVAHFVLMLQEAVRSGDVPELAAGALGARRIDAPRTKPTDIVSISRKLGLSLIYVPSMRNGDSIGEDKADRGSAILSTLPLAEPTAIELPGERQRRVGILARLALPAAAGVPVIVGVIHLDALGSAKRLWLFGTSWMRERQAHSLGSLLPEGHVILGADLNTWHGRDEPARRYLAELVGHTPTSITGFGLGLRVLDYMFFRAGGNRSARYAVLPQDYGSDHRPLIGWVDAPTEEVSARRQ